MSMDATVPSAIRKFLDSPTPHLSKGGKWGFIFNLLIFVPGLIYYLVGGAGVHSALFVLPIAPTWSAFAAAPQLIKMLVGRHLLFETPYFQVMIPFLVFFLGFLQWTLVFTLVSFIRSQVGRNTS